MTDHQHAANLAAEGYGHGKTASVALYFLAEHYCSKQQSPLAVDVIGNEFDGRTELPWRLLALKAEALHALGQQDNAIDTARQALAMAPADHSRQSLVARFAALSIAI